MNLTQHMLTTSILLAAFAVTGTGLVAVTYENTKEQIAQAEREYLLQNLYSVVDPKSHDNELFNDQIMVKSPEYLGSKQALSIFRARINNQPVAAIITAIAPDGYNGDIKLLIGVHYDGTLSGVRVINHRETPGLGDAIETKRGDWILQFDGHSLANPGQKKWKVKKDGGYYDQLTGATITPRAIVKAVYKALQYYDQNKDMIFSEPSQLSASVSKD